MGEPTLERGFRGRALGARVAAGLATFGFVWPSDFGLARASALLAVAAIVADWALAQDPQFLPGLTVSEAAHEPTAERRCARVAGTRRQRPPTAARTVRLRLRGRGRRRDGPQRPIWATAVGIALMVVGAASAFVLATTMPDTEQADDISA
jgi:hypothetical protein